MNRYHTTPESVRGVTAVSIRDNKSSVLFQDCYVRRPGYCPAGAGAVWHVGGGTIYWSGGSLTARRHGGEQVAYAKVPWGEWAHLEWVASERSLFLETLTAPGFSPHLNDHLVPTAHWVWATLASGEKVIWSNGLDHFEMRQY